MHSFYIFLTGFLITLLVSFYGYSFGRLFQKKLKILEDNTGLAIGLGFLSYFFTFFIINIFLSIFDSSIGVNYVVISIFHGLGLFLFLLNWKIYYTKIKWQKVIFSLLSIIFLIGITVTFTYFIVDKNSVLFHLTDFLSNFKSEPSTYKSSFWDNNNWHYKYQNFFTYIGYFGWIFHRLNVNTQEIFFYGASLPLIVMFYSITVSIVLFYKRNLKTWLAHLISFLFTIGNLFFNHLTQGSLVDIQGIFMLKMMAMLFFILICYYFANYYYHRLYIFFAFLFLIIFSLTPIGFYLLIIFTFLYFFIILYKDSTRVIRELFYPAVIFFYSIFLILIKINLVVAILFFALSFIALIGFYFIIVRKDLIVNKLNNLLLQSRTLLIVFTSIGVIASSVIYFIVQLSLIDYDFRLIFSKESNNYLLFWKWNNILNLDWSNSLAVNISLQIIAVIIYITALVLSIRYWRILIKTKREGNKLLIGAFILSFTFVLFWNPITSPLIITIIGTDNILYFQTISEISIIWVFINAFILFINKLNYKKLIK